jgi:hypothetical protein
MTTNHHTPVPFGAAATTANLNSPLGELDSAITDAEATAGVSSGDTTPDYLENKIVTTADSGITLTKLNPGADEELQITAPVNLDFGNNIATLSTTSTTYVDVDPTNFNLTLTTTGRDVLLTFSGVVRHTTTTATSDYDVNLDGTLLGSVTLGSAALSKITNPDAATNNIIMPINFSIIVSGLSAASHTFNLQWKVSAGTVTLRGTNAVCQFSVREI